MGKETTKDSKPASVQDHIRFFQYQAKIASRKLSELLAQRNSRLTDFEDIELYTREVSGLYADVTRYECYVAFCHKVTRNWLSLDYKETAAAKYMLGPASNQPAGSEDAEEHYRVWEDVKKRLHDAQNAQDWLAEHLNVTQAEVDAIPEE